MHIKTLLEMLNNTEKVETTDLDGRNFKREVQNYILMQAKELFPELEVKCKVGGKWVTQLKQ